MLAAVSWSDGDSSMSAESGVGQHMGDHGISLVTHEDYSIVVKGRNGSGRERTKQGGGVAQEDDAGVGFSNESHEVRHGVGVAEGERFPLIVGGSVSVLTEDGRVTGERSGPNSAEAKELGESFVGHGPTKLEWMKQRFKRNLSERKLVFLLRCKESEQRERGKTVCFRLFNPHLFGRMTVAIYCFERLSA